MVVNLRPGRDLDTCTVTRDEYICQALKLLPEGAMWDRDDRDLMRFYSAIASFFYDEHVKNCETAKECNPCTAEECVSEWFDFFGLDESCVLSDPKEAICQAISSKNGLNCDTIAALALAEGYIVTDCRMCDETTDEVITPTACKANPGGSIPCAPYENLTDNSCADKFGGLPCEETLIAECCEGDVEPVEAPEVDLCAIEQNEGGCECPSAFNMGSAVIFGEPYSPLACPFSIEITIDPASPSGAPSPNGLLNGNPGASLPADCPPFEICSVEAFLPLGYTAKYVRGC